MITNDTPPTETPASSTGDTGFCVDCGGHHANHNGETKSPSDKLQALSREATVLLMNAAKDKGADTMSMLRQGIMEGSDLQAPVKEGILADRYRVLVLEMVSTVILIGAMACDGREPEVHPMMRFIGGPAPTPITKPMLYSRGLVEHSIKHNLDARAKTIEVGNRLGTMVSLLKGKDIVSSDTLGSWEASKHSVNFRTVVAMVLTDVLNVFDRFMDADLLNYQPAVPVETKEEASMAA